MPETVSEAKERAYMLIVLPKRSSRVTVSKHSIPSKGGECYQAQEQLIREAYRESLTIWHNCNLFFLFFFLGSRVLSITLLGERSTNHIKPKKYNRYHSFYTVPILITDRNKEEFWKRKHSLSDSFHALPTIFVIGLNNCLGSRETWNRGWEALNS